MELWMLASLSAGALTTAVAVSAILWYRRRCTRLLEQVLDRINAAIAGNDTEVTYNEAMLSVIDEKLNQFLSISRETKQRTLQEKDTIKSLVSDISHQIKTPLSNISLYSQLLFEREEIQEGAAAMVLQIQKQADKLNFLMKALIKSSYLETELIATSANPESMDKLILLACQEVEISALRKEITIEFAECGFTCFFDLKWTLEAIGNILENAVKYSPEGTSIVIKIMQYEMFYKIDIKDSGIGITEEEQGLIFQRFYRSQRVHQEQGLGIGLYLAREIITRQGGYIKVSSQALKGAVFSIFLPC